MMKMMVVVVVVRVATVPAVLAVSAKKQMMIMATTIPTMRLTDGKQEMAAD